MTSTRFPLRDIAGFDVSTLDLEGNAQAVMAAAREGRSAWIVTLNLEMIARAAQDEAYRTLLAASDLMVADGMPLIWLSRLKGGPAISGRTTGIDLTEALLRRYEGPIGVLGGIAPCAALEKLAVPASRIVYVDSGKVDPGHLERQIDELRASGCRILFVALGVPKQDLVCRRLREACPGLVCLGVGGTFEVLGGQLARAPRWVQATGLEWLHRLLKEPGRLWRRYLLRYPRALPVIVRWAWTAPKKPTL